MSQESPVSNIVEITKRCTKCGENKPLSDFPLGPRRDGRKPISRCRICKNASSADWAKRNAEHVRKQKAKAREIARLKNASALPAESSRVCTKCNVEWSIGNFCKNNRGKPSWQCRACNAAYGRERRKKFSEEILSKYAGYEKNRRNRLGKRGVKSSNLRHVYGLSLDAYDAMAQSQGEKCAICRRAFSSFRKSPAVDHDHTTGAVRGILCGPCNGGLGMLGDDPDRLEAAAAYLRRSRGET